MHCSANIGKNGDTAIFFGLSGTGKTTLSSDPNRRLIGDDEHGWSDNTVFNFEGGCYAKTIDLTREKEPQIYDAIKFGALLENIGFENESSTPDYTDNTITENNVDLQTEAITETETLYSEDFVYKKPWNKTVEINDKVKIIGNLCVELNQLMVLLGPIIPDKITDLRG